LIAYRARPIDVGSLAAGYRLLVSSDRSGQAVENFWHEQIVMNWVNGRKFRGLGACAAMLSSARPGRASLHHLR